MKPFSNALYKFQRIFYMRMNYDAFPSLIYKGVYSPSSDYPIKTSITEYKNCQVAGQWLENADRNWSSAVAMANLCLCTRRLLPSKAIPLYFSHILFILIIKTARQTSGLL